MGTEGKTTTNGGMDGMESDSSVSWEDFFGTTIDLVSQILRMFDEKLEQQSSEKKESTTICRYPGCENRKRRSSTGGGGTERPLSASSTASSNTSSSSIGSSNHENESLADTCSSSQGSRDSGVGDTTLPTDERCRDERRGEAHRPRYCDPDKNPVERVVLEIVDTEVIYVEHLRQVIQGYLIYWRDDPASLVQQLQLDDLFSNIEDIYEFNRKFLDEIENCHLDPVKLAEKFIKHETGFEVYTEYCTNYPRTVSVLTDLLSREKNVRAFHDRQTALEHSLPLSAFLLKPVQRILKYHLLLENLSKEFRAEGSEGIKILEEALSAMTGIAKHINAMKRRHEDAVRVQEIQSSVVYGWTGPDLTTSGELLIEGKFGLRGAKAPRYVFLFEKILLLTKQKEDGGLIYKAHVNCSNLMLIESIQGDPLSFHVVPFDNPRLQHTLQARNVEQKRAWTLRIKRIILEHYNAVIPSRSMQLVLELGQGEEEEKTINKKSFTLKRPKQTREHGKTDIGLKHMINKIGKESPLGTRKMKNRRMRKSEPDFRSYINFMESDDDEICPAPSLSTTDLKIEDKTIIISDDSDYETSSRSSTLTSTWLMIDQLIIDDSPLTKTKSLPRTTSNSPEGSFFKKRPITIAFDRPPEIPPPPPLPTSKYSLWKRNVVSMNNNNNNDTQVWYKQGSSSLGARIAQPDYADPKILFAPVTKVEQEDNNYYYEDSFYEKNFENSMENLMLKPQVPAKPESLAKLVCERRKQFIVSTKFVTNNKINNNNDAKQLNIGWVKKLVEQFQNSDN